MGKAKDKKKKLKKKQGLGKEKTELKTEKNAKRKALKQKNDNDEDEEDIEKIIERFKKMDAAKVAVTEEILSSNPTPRLNASLLVHPTKETELILFGGEFFDGDQTYVYNDLLRYNIEKKEWKQISSANSPPPRCSHQAITYKNWMYVFGGEFTSPSQNQFYHYKDMWRLNCDTNVWENVQDVKNSPSARSGHRMVRWKNKLFLFGGFYDTLTEVKYYNDLHVMDLDSHKWTKVEFKFTDSVPLPRSGFQMGVFENSLFLYGGYSKEKTKKYSEAKGIVHTDMWTMNLNSPNLTWEKVKKSGIAPSPRSGAAVAVSNKKMILFGGVFDQEEKDDIKSIFYNEVFAFHMDNRRWFPVNLQMKKSTDNKKRRAKKGQAATPSTPQNTSTNKAEEESLTSSNGSRKESYYDDEDYYDNEYYEDYEEDETENGDKSSSLDIEKNSNTPKEASVTPVVTPVTQKTENVSSPAAPKESLVDSTNSTNTATATTNTEDSGPTPLLPSPRINCNMVIIGNTLYLYGGLFESEKREIAYNDLYTLNLHRLDTFEVVIPPTIPDWRGEESDDEDYDDEDDEEGSDEESEEEVKEPEEEEEEEDSKEKADEEEENEKESKEEDEEEEKVEEEKVKKVKKSKKRYLDELKDRLAAFEKDGIATANPHETLRQFFDRTKDFWTRYAFEVIQKQGNLETDDKVLKRNGFQHADERWKEMRPLLEEFERLEQEATVAAQEKKKEKEKRRDKKR